MKKLFTLLAIGLIATLTSNLSGQSQRLVLAEEYTQASCPPCASQNPTFNGLLQDNGDKIVSIKYQTSWPGVDPMNADNPTEVQNRVDFYGVNSVPVALIDGMPVADDCDYYLGAPACLSQEDIDAAYEVPASFSITVDATVNEGVIDVTTSLNCTQDASGDLKLFVVLIEKVIDWGTAPGSNGEVVFYNVMKKFLPNASGIDIPGSWTNGETNAYIESLNLDEINVYDMEQLSVVAFIQDISTNEILQAGMQLPNYNNSASAIYFSGLPQLICSNETISPVLRIQNDGKDELTSAIITYSINEGENQIINWSGSVNTFGRANVELGDQILSEDENVITATISMPNGEEDEDSILNDSQTATIGLAPVAYLELTMVLNTDCWPEENTWEIRNSSNTVVASGGPYEGQVETEITENISLPTDDCYSFIFMDSYGDGLHGSQWTDCSTDGNLNVFDAYNHSVFSYDGSCGAPEIIGEFEGSVSVLGIEELSTISDFKIYPNPTNNVAHIAMNLTEANSVTIEVVDLLGKVVYSEEIGNLPTGRHLFDVDASSIGTGLYMFNIYVGTQKVTERVSINK